ncbi:MAG: tRNA (N(6)-L-threonylcarbamoyladenosine(37)-C(2))-methylthiotransferase [bacterium]|nr:tRNA (N(6)-L-threonylcarbamoyladenosine(37)-C(2))-methylthiotransferase [bacterium]
MKSVSVETYGCTLNRADSDIMKGILEEAGYLLSPDSPIFILNTCAVKETTENKLIFRIEKLKSEGKKIVVAGCLGMGPNEKRVREADPDAVIVLPDAISHIVEAVECAGKGEAKTFSGGSEKGMLPRIYTEPILRVAVQEGCVGNCYFCQTRIARPKLTSQKPLWIKRWVEEGVKKGAKEIQITGQDTGAYGLDIGSSLPEMLNEVLSVEGEFRVRLGMINPGHAKKLLPELLEIMGNEKFYKFLHIPVQSGSEKVREEMNRMHTVADFEGVVSKVRKRFPDATISTDIIVGYPTESAEDFEASKELLERVKPDIVNISKFSSRKGTEASRLKKIDTREVKGRTVELSGLVKKLGEERNSKYLGREEKVLITEIQKTPTGRMGNYKQVCVNAE